MIPPPVGVVLSRVPELGADVDIPVAVHVADDRLVAAEAVVEQGIKAFKKKG